MALTAMKAWRYVKPFRETVDEWEQVLSQVLEVTELLLVVQRLWTYMEVSGQDVGELTPACWIM